ncbi:MAG: haloacid dehalogenase, partial [Chloroflexi bacterium]|nr:haloacid dehalogenase [Chloroflexota bacterium]
MTVAFNSPPADLAIAAVILDMDGVLWRDSQPIGDLAHIFAAIRRRGWKLTLATNNATRTVAQYQEKLHAFGVDLLPEQIVNSSQAVLHELLRRYPGGGGVYVVG